MTKTHVLQILSNYKHLIIPLQIAQDSHVQKVIKIKQ